MPMAKLTWLDGAHRQKALWLTAALVVLVTIGAAYFAFRRERGARDPAQVAEGAAPPPPVTVDNAPEAAIWNLPAGWTQSMKERAFAEYQRCSRLLHEDPFAELPQRPGGYTVGYWISRATESGQPLALVEKAISSLPAATRDSDEAEGARGEAREMLVKATLSGNPDALLLMGFMMRGSNDPERELQGAAWMLAGCQAGADCGFDSAIVPIWMCYDGGDVQCPPGMDVETMLGRALSPAEFAQAHARYERISAALRARDAEAMSAQLGSMCQRLCIGADTRPQAEAGSMNRIPSFSRLTRPCEFRMMSSA
jgi:hypothetical protein